MDWHGCFWPLLFAVANMNHLVYEAPARQSICDIFQNFRLLKSAHRVRIFFRLLLKRDQSYDVDFPWLRNTGFFANGAIALQGRLPGGPRALHSGHTPPTYWELTLQAHQRRLGLTVQPSARQNAFVVPAQMATFGGRAGQKLPPPVQQKM